MANRIGVSYFVNMSKGLEQSLESSFSVAARATLVPARSPLFNADGNGSVTVAVEPAPKSVAKACCLWCHRAFRPRMTGGSSQKFCCTAHRQQFWIARRWTMRAIEVGLLSVDCLKASHTSVHAVPGGILT
jgi:hypothetical protein